MSFARVEGEAVYSEERTPGIGGGIGSDMGDDHAYSTDGGGVRQVVDLGMTQLRMLRRLVKTPSTATRIF